MYIISTFLKHIYKQFKQWLSNIISLISAIGAISVNSYVEVLQGDH